MKTPSVTTVLSPWSDFSQVPSDVLDGAAERGKRVHALCAAWAQGLFAVPGQQDRGYFESFQRWFDAWVEEVIAVEAEYLSRHGYSGRPDLICRIKGDELASVVDFKTPLAVHRAWRPQLAAYRQLANECVCPTKRAFCLRLKRDGSRAIVDEELPETLDRDFRIFCYALAVWKFFNNT